MKLIPKLIRRIIMIWVFYGVYKFCIFVNPYLFWIAQKIKPVYDDNSRWSTIPDIPWDSSDSEQIFEVWFFTLVFIIVLGLIIAGIHYFSEWLFNEGKDNE